MRRKITIALLAFGTFAGYGSALCHAARHHRAECAGWHSGANDANGANDVK
jgi:hypothetical protein